MSQDDKTIVMYDEEGNESSYQILATKKDGDCLYMLAEEESDVLIFKCIEEAEDMVFELVDEDHESFDLAFSLFKEDLDDLGVEY